MKKILITLITSISLTVFAIIELEQIKSGSDILASDLNFMFGKVTTELANNPDLTDITFQAYTNGEEVSRLGTKGILTQLYTITELYPNQTELHLLLGFEDENGVTVDPDLVLDPTGLTPLSTGGYINSGELNYLFNKVILDIQNYTVSSGGGVVIAQGDQIVSNDSSFAMIQDDGSVIAWGDVERGGLIPPATASQLDGTIKVVKIVPSNEAYAALREDGSVITWGAPDRGGDSTSPNGTVVDSVNGSEIYTDVSQDLDGTIKVVDITPNTRAFAALREDGSVVTWGSSDYGGNHRLGGGLNIASQLDASTGNKVVKIVADADSFFALRDDKKGYCWGNNQGLYGLNNSVDNVGDIERVFPNRGYLGFVYQKTSGNVHAVNISGVHYDLGNRPEVIDMVGTIQANIIQFADGSGVKWASGGGGYGSISNNVADGTTLATKIKKLQITRPYLFSNTSTSLIIAVIMEDGSLKKLNAFGGLTNIALPTGTKAVSVTADINNNYMAILDDGSTIGSTVNTTTQAVDVALNIVSSAVLNADGSVQCAGNSSFGGVCPAGLEGTDDALDVVKLYSNIGAFVAVRADGSIVVWGREANGGLGPQ